MESASGYIYVNKNQLQKSNLNQEQIDEFQQEESQDCVDSEELDGDLNISQSNDIELIEKKEQIRLQKAQWKITNSRIFKQKIDTNVFVINFKQLQNSNQICTEKPIYCQKCKSILNMHSKISNEVSKLFDDEEQLVWNCEFCNFKNSIFLENQEKPQANLISYLMCQHQEQKGKKSEIQDSNCVIFCIDQSGSMCCTQLHNDQSIIDKKDDFEIENQIDQNEKYISRMQCIQSAISLQIKKIQNDNLDRKVGIIAFNDDVTVYGDGSQQPQIISGESLDDYDFLIQNGKIQYKERMNLRINEQESNLQSVLHSLEEKGQTALGPAVATAVGIASEGATGSVVVVCTDGLANIGVGSFNSGNPQKSDQFYEILGLFAKQKGVTINIVSIEGDECNLESLSILTEKTGGDVFRVGPIDLYRDQSLNFSQSVIASNVIVKVFLHQMFKFKNESSENVSKDLMQLTRDIGSVTSESEITFEYSLKDDEFLQKQKQFDILAIEQFPFQAQILFKNLDGSKYIQVITEMLSISTEKEFLFQNANYEILCKNVMLQSACMARAGSHRYAQANIKLWKRKLLQNQQNQEQKRIFNLFLKRMNDIYNCMADFDQQELQEKQLGALFQYEEDQENILLNIKKNNEKDLNEMLEIQQKIDQEDQFEIQNNVIEKEKVSQKEKVKNKITSIFKNIKQKLSKKQDKKKQIEKQQDEIMQKENNDSKKFQKQLNFLRESLNVQNQIITNPYEKSKDFKLKIDDKYSAQISYMSKFSKF